MRICGLHNRTTSPNAGGRASAIESFFQPQFRTQFADEVKQKQAISDHLINKILFSKRLLVDHVEALEQCLRHVKQPVVSPDQTDTSGTAATSSATERIAYAQTNTEIFTARNTCILLGTTILEHFVTPKWLRLTLVPSLLLTTGFSAVYMIKNIFIFRNKIVEGELDSLIRTIDEFGNCIRRNMTYFNEILIMKQQELIESRQIERAWDCITSAKEVTEILYDATRKLEAQYPLPARFAQYYSPMEELRECEYFKNNVTDYSPKHIKDFHNIFAYVQSQFLLRLALTISTKPSISELNAELVKIDCLIRQLVQEEENHFRNLAIELNKRKQLELEALNATKAMQNRSSPVAVLQDSSLKLSACMVAVAGECQALDITLQRLTETEAEQKDNAKQLLQVANNMRAIESALSVCFDDFQRLMLVYNKFLNSNLDNQEHPTAAENESSAANNDEFPESFLRVEISQNHNDSNNRDDFYAYMYDEQQAQAEREQQEADVRAQSSTDRDMEILNFEKRITKGKFRPVLKQLKDRIDPIRNEMLEKERQVLAAKGINVDDFFGKEENTRTIEGVKPQNNASSIVAEHNDDGTSDSEGSADLELQRSNKKLKDRDNFAEMRNFLAQKQAINIFKLDATAPITTTGDEEILESEC
uniref:Vezatin n=1 Tax=Ceratitis capitata TaxID=7213 RepID=W8ALR3_CERCA